MGDVRILEDKEVDGNDAPPPVAKWLTYLIEFIILVLAIFLVFLVRQSWLEPAVVTSDSMEDTLQRGDRYLVDHRRSIRGTWKRGDVVLMETSNEAWGDDTLVKRIIGLPGERVDYLNGQVYIDGKALAENYLKETPQSEDTRTIILGDSEYYVLGDNRNNSEDSRDHGAVSGREIRGRIVWKLWPPGGLPSPGYAE